MAEPKNVEQVRSELDDSINICVEVSRVAAIVENIERQTRRTMLDLANFLEGHNVYPEKNEWDKLVDRIEVVEEFIKDVDWNRIVGK